MTSTLRALVPTLALAALVPASFLACRSGSSPSLAEPAAAPPVIVPPPMSKRSTTAYEASGIVPPPERKPEDYSELHNVYALSPHVLSGSEPHGEEAFRILRDKGVKTILSVDGKVPDAEMAAQYGMKYVHVPIQYKGITDEEVARIAKTFREQEGPFFVHCFHGKHRGPAAAEIGRLVLDGIPREEALAEMRQCGTAPTYEGLYAAIAYAEIPTEGQSRRLDWDFPSASPLDGIAGAMVQVSRADDHLKAASKLGWKPDPKHPDLSALNEATKLASLFERALALPDVAAQPEDFRAWMQDSRVQAAALLDVVRSLEKGQAQPAQADAAYKTLAKTCTACHDAYRN